MFNKNYIVYYNVYCVLYCGVFIEKCVYQVSSCCISELHGHLRPYHNVLPEAVYCCFTSYGDVTSLFRGRYGYLSVHKVSFLNSVWLLRYASRN